MKISPRTRWLRAMLVASTAIVPLAYAPAIYAQGQKSARSDEILFDIPAQPLARSLNAVARASSLKIAYSAPLASNKSAPALQGTFTARNALDRLLAGSGLSYSLSSDGIVTIFAASAASADTGGGATVLEKIIVTAGGAGSAPTDAELQSEVYRGVGTSAFISQENIQRFRGSSTGDMLSGIPGVLNGENRNSGALDVNIRGMQGQGRAPVVIDGSRQDSTVYRGYAGIAGRTYIDPDFIGGVSIEKGPSMGADASGAIGGIVRARTLNANDIVAPGGTWGVTVKGGLADNNSSPPAWATPGGDEAAVRNYNPTKPFDFRGKNGSVAAAYKSDMFDIVAAHSQRSIGNYYTGSRGVPAIDWVPPVQNFNPTVLFGFNEQVINTSVDSSSYLLRGVFRPDEDHTLDLSYIRYDSLFGEMKPSQMRHDTPYQSPSDVEVDTYTARYRYNPENSLIDFRADLWATTVDSYTVDPSRFPGFNRDKFSATLSERWGATIHNTSSFSGAAGDLALNYGYSYDHEDFGKSDAWNALDQRYPGRSWDHTPEGETRKDSLFINAEYKPEQWLTFTAGTRYLENVVQDFRSPTFGVGEGTVNRDEAKGWAPAFSALVEPVKGIQFYGRYAESLRASSSFEGVTGFSADVNPFVDLRPERNHSTEFGINYLKSGILTSDDLFQAKLSWFNNDITDYITMNTEDVGGFQGVPVRTNIPKVLMRGIELSASYDAGRFFGSFGATNYTDKEFCYAGNTGEGVGCFDQVPSTAYSWFAGHVPPKRSFSATIGGRFLDEKLSLGARYTYLGRKPATELFDLFGSYRVSDSATLSFTVDNLFDRYYVDPLSLGDGGAYLASPGRTIRVNFVSRFGDGNRAAVSSAEAREQAAALADKSAPLMGDFNGDWSGFYLGADWGGQHFAAHGNTTAAGGVTDSVAAAERTDIETNAFLGGLHGGYNHQLGSGLVLGFEVDGGYTRAREEVHFIAPELAGAGDGPERLRIASYEHSYGAVASARARMGQSFGRTLLYGTGGLGLVHEKQTRLQYMSRNGLNSQQYFSETDEQIRPGVVLGGGLEYAFSDKLSLRTEYLFGYYPEKTLKFDQARAGVMEGGSVDAIAGREADNTLTTHTVRVGLNYRF